MLLLSLTLTQVFLSLTTIASLAILSEEEDSVQISLCTDGCPMKAKIELLQGPDNNKQVMEIDTEDGRLRPFYAIVDTPGAGNVIRIINTSCIEFPLYANIELYSEKVFDPI